MDRCIPSPSKFDDNYGAFILAIIGAILGCVISLSMVLQATHSDSDLIRLTAADNVPLVSYKVLVNMINYKAWITFTIYDTIG